MRTFERGANIFWLNVSNCFMTNAFSCGALSVYFFILFLSGLYVCPLDKSLPVSGFASDQCHPGELHQCFLILCQSWFFALIYTLFPPCSFQLCTGLQEIRARNARLQFQFCFKRFKVFESENVLSFTRVYQVLVILWGKKRCIRVWMRKNEPATVR